MLGEKGESDICCTATLGCLHARPALEHGLEGWVGFGNEGRALKTLQVEQTRAGVKARREKAEGWLGHQCGQGNQSGWRVIIHKARKGATPRLSSKCVGSHAADYIWHFILKVLGHKRNVNYKTVGNHG